jgi:hypothetical protein
MCSLLELGNALLKLTQKLGDLVHLLKQDLALIAEQLQFRDPLFFQLDHHHTFLSVIVYAVLAARALI